MGHRYLEVMMKFFEVSSFEGIIIEGHRMFPEKAQEIKEKAMAQAREAALRF
jgi:FMN-dependent NADH-azoreductase